jgi:hypothetical protein
MSDAPVAEASGAAHWLSLAATPVFAFMALQTAQGGAAGMLCSAAHGASPLGGMAPMYLLMSVFHAAPWMKLARRVTAGAARAGR